MSAYDYLADIKKRHPEPFFTFPAIPPFHEFSFEPLTVENSEQLFHLFENDPSPFVDKRFKTKEGAKEHAQWVMEYGPYIPKHGGRDWLFKINGQYAGILHLYDLSLETFMENHKRAWVGFAAAENVRRKALTSKAVRHFIDILFRFYERIDFIHAYIMKENHPSANFLLKAGFQPDQTEGHPENYRFFLLTRNAFYSAAKATD